MSSKTLTYTQSIPLPSNAPFSLVLSRLQDAHFLLSLQPLIQSDQPSRNSFLNDKTLTFDDSATLSAISNREDTVTSAGDTGDQPRIYTYRNLVFYTRIGTSVAHEWRATISKVEDGACVVTEAPNDVRVVEVWKVEGAAKATGNSPAERKEKVGEPMMEDAARRSSGKEDLVLQRRITIQVKNGWWYSGGIKKEVEGGLHRTFKAVAEWIDEGLSDGKAQAAICA